MSKVKLIILFLWLPLISVFKEDKKDYLSQSNASVLRSNKLECDIDSINHKIDSLTWTRLR